jgi:hypothetical protein
MLQTKIIQLNNFFTDENDAWTHDVSMIGTDLIGICKSNYHMITTMTAPKFVT